MEKIESTIITIGDLERAISALEATLTFLQARDIMEAQISMRPIAPNMLALEIDFILKRMQGIVKDYYYERAVEDRPSETNVQPEEEEPLPPTPLGSPTVNRALEPWDFPGNSQTDRDDPPRRLPRPEER